VPPRENDPMTNSNRTARWRDIDFRPAPPGWRAVYIDVDGNARTEHVAGWLIQEEEFYGQTGRKHPRGDTQMEDRDRRVVPAFHYADEFGVTLVGVDVVRGLWRILAPGQPDPTSEEIEAAGYRAEQAGTAVTESRHSR
jgi:hypothetical protein